MPSRPSEIVASVILYHPEKYVVQNILSYLKAVSKVYVLDNSEIYDPLVVSKIKTIPNVHYFSNDGNKGIASALNLAADRAINDGFEWLLTMDQDSSFADKKFFDFFHAYSSKSDVAIFSPVHVETSYDSSKSDQPVMADIVMTSGNLLNLSIFTHVGRFKEKLFIDEVDHEYCLRARTKGYKILVFPAVLLNHQLGKEIKVGERTFTTHNPIRVYYIFRNGFYIINRYWWRFPGIVWQRLMNLLIVIFSIVRHQERKGEKMRMAGIGFLHFLVGRYGRK